MLNAEQDESVSVYQTHFVFVPFFSKLILTWQTIFTRKTLPGNRLNHSCRKTRFKNITNGDGYGNGNENGKKAKALDWQNKNFARASRFFVHFLALVARLRRKSA